MGKEAKFVVRLDADERRRLQTLVGDERHAASVLKRAQILLQADQSENGPAWNDVQIAAFTRLSTLEDPDKFGAWLHTITRNRCLQFLKEKLRRRLAHLGYQAEQLLHLESPDEYLVREKEIQIIHQLISSVANKSQRETVRLYYVEGLGCEAIGEKQGIKPTTVTTRVARFRAKVQRELIRRILELQAGHE